MIVSQLMTRDVLTVRPETSLKDVAALLATHRISGLPVVQDGEVLGVVSEADILYKERGPQAPRDGILARLRPRADIAERKAAARTAGEAMTSPALTVGPRRRVAEAARLMIERGVNRLPVVDRSGLVGIVTRADLVRAFDRPDVEIARDIRDDVLTKTFWLSPADVQVTVTNGAVVLSGAVDTRTLAELLPRFVQSVPGVVSVAADLTWRVDDRSAQPVV
jgi:CBS domain-containing protein